MVRVENYFHLDVVSHPNQQILRQCRQKARYRCNNWPADNPLGVTPSAVLPFRPSPAHQQSSASDLRSTRVHAPRLPEKSRISRARTVYLLSLGHRADDVRVARVRDGHAAHAEVFAAGGAQLDVVAVVVVHARLGQHGVVLDLGFPVGARCSVNGAQVNGSQTPLSPMTLKIIIKK